MARVRLYWKSRLPQMWGAGDEFALSWLKPLLDRQREFICVAALGWLKLLLPDDRPRGSVQRLLFGGAVAIRSERSAAAGQ